MRIIAISQLKRFWEKYPDSEQSFLVWMDEARNAEWKMPADIRARFASASILKSRRVVFNIK
jgi:mRNA interferase HigB